MIKTIIDLLNHAATKHKLFSSLDIQLAIRLADKENPLLILIFALLSAENRLGHVCLFIDQIKPEYFFEGKQSELAITIWKIVGSPDINKIYTELKNSHAVCEIPIPQPQQQLTVKPKPLVLIDNKLYFQRMWADEELVANFFSCNLLENIDEDRLSAILNSFCIFSTTEKDWQKIAVAVAITSRISIISGAPGTGKTTIVACLLTTLIKLSDKNLIIQLATPTGKAAAKLTESLNNTLLNFKISNIEYKMIPKQAQTIHRLLGAKLNSHLMHYNKSNLLSLDVLIIDEASMVGLSLMARLIEALPSHARVILLGDKNQLASVEAGAVLEDLCYFAEFGYSSRRINQLTKITGYDLSDFIAENDAIELKDRICLLRKSYRFDAQSGIGLLATAISQGNIKYVKELLSQQRTDITLHSINNTSKYRKLITNVMDGYLSYLDMVKKSKDYEEIIHFFINHYRLLTALREGPYGVVGLNNNLEQLLYFRGNINRASYRWNKNYEGRPIMITQNNHSLGLFNGDIGIMLPDSQGKYGLKAYFLSSNGVIKKIKPNCLPKYETAYVMTVHKAQGLEFEHVALVLPPVFSQVISKELIYTAITRARNQLTIYADSHIFIKAILTPTKRHSGLTESLMKKQDQ